MLLRPRSNDPRFWPSGAVVPRTGPPSGRGEPSPTEWLRDILGWADVQSEPQHWSIVEIQSRVFNSQLVGSAAPRKELWAPCRLVASSPATLLLVAVNVAVFFWIWMHSALNASPHTLSRYGANWGYQTLSGQWWRLLTSLFVHTETAHLLLNMVGLLLFGSHIEKIMGTRGLMLLYFSCGLAGGISLIAFRPDASGYGASLSVLGLLGGLIGFYCSRLAALSKGARWKLALLFAVMVVSIWDDISAFRSGNPGHIAGLLAGVILGIVFGVKAGAAKRHVFMISALVALLLVVSATIARLCNPVVPSLYAAARAFDSGENDTALAEINVVLQNEPDNISANKIASEVFLKEPDYLRAEKAIRKVLAANKDDEYFLYLLGIVELRTSRCDQANAIAGQLARLRSNYAPMLSQSPCYVSPKGFSGQHLE